jgi:hypothetical protein
MSRMSRIKKPFVFHGLRIKAKAKKFNRMQRIDKMGAGNRKPFIDHLYPAYPVHPV